MIFKTVEFKVGFLVVLGLILMSCLFTLVTENNTPFFGQTKTLWFDIENANGLIKQGRVKMFGIPVGVIEDIKIARNQARVFVKVKKDLLITTSSEIQLITDGVLGDRYIEIYPGDPNDPLLEDGGNISQKRRSINISHVMNLLSDTFASIQKTSESMQKILELKSQHTDISVLENMIVSTNAFVENLKNFSERNLNKIDRMVSRMDNVTKKLSDFVEVEGFENLENSS